MLRFSHQNMQFLILHLHCINSFCELPNTIIMNRCHQHVLRCAANHQFQIVLPQLYKAIIIIKRCCQSLSLKRSRSIYEQIVLSELSLLSEYLRICRLRAHPSKGKTDDSLLIFSGHVPETLQETFLNASWRSLC